MTAQTQLQMMPDAVVLVAVHTRDRAEDSVDAGIWDDSDGDTDTDIASTAVASSTSDVSSQGDYEFGFGTAEGSSIQEAGDEKVVNHMMGAAFSISESGDSTSSDSADEVEEHKEMIVGTLELAFSQAVRSNFVTLNPPLDGAYLSNMCIAVEYRQRGFGKELLAAAEQLTRLTAYRQIYLHNRFQDKPAAALYKSCGYEVIKQDNWLWGLVGQDRRYLMRKYVPADVES